MRSTKAHSTALAPALAMKPVTTALLALVLSPFGQAQGLFPSVVFEHRGWLDAGAAQLVLVQHGAYVYGSAAADDRSWQPALLMGKVQPRYYAWFIEQEVAALHPMQDVQLVPPAPARPSRRHTPRAATAATQTASAKTEPIRILLQGDAVCVPRVEVAASSDWRSQLHCWPAHKVAP